MNGKMPPASGLSDLARWIRIGAWFCVAVTSIWSVIAFWAAAWGSLPNAGTTLSSSAWNDIVGQLNTLASSLNVSGGNVGIGKSAPDAKLDVNGEMIRNVFYLEPTTVINQNYAGNAWTNLPGTWAFTYAKKSSTSKLLVTINAVVRGNYSTSWWWTQLGMNVNGTNWDFWGGYTNTTDMHTPGMYRRAISGIPKGTVNLQWTVYPSNTAWLCIGCTGVPNVTIEEIY